MLVLVCYIDPSKGGILSGQSFLLFLVEERGGRHKTIFYFLGK